MAIQGFFRMNDGAMSLDLVVFLLLLIGGIGILIVLWTKRT